MANKETLTIAILGASGLIGQAVATHLISEGFRVAALARRFTSAQRELFGSQAIESAIVALDEQALGKLLENSAATVIVNCIGVLQDSVQRGTAADAHSGFVKRLVASLSASKEPSLLIHVSIPGRAEDDRTSFSATKREAENIITANGLPYVILRPGFVVAPAAYGGSALIRALAASPFDLPQSDASSPFAATDVEDIGRTVAVVVERWAAGDRDWRVCWDVMEESGGTVGDVIHSFRRHLGGPARAMSLPAWASVLGAKAGDLVSHLGWQPPLRSNAFAELQRGVTGDPTDWISATGKKPASLDEMLKRLPSTVQERWFARLYLLKPIIIGSLALFWIISGLIALTVAFDAAVGILTTHGFSSAFAKAVTVVSSIADIAIGAAIAHRKTCRAGLLTGIGLSVFYMLSAAIITPDMWVEPLGALVKTGPAIVLMLVALATLDDR